MADFETTRVREYKDVSLTFGKNPVTNDVVTVSGDEAVRRSLKTLLFTIAGEVPFFPSLGSRISRLLFEPIDVMTTALLSSEISDTIDAFEPRVKLLALDVVPTEDENAYKVTMTYRLVNLAEPVTLSIFLTRLR
jgi:phage baseplate assembly protein W